LVLLLGHPVEHSLSPALHNAAFRALGLAHSYELLDVTADALPGAVGRIRSGEVLGANVTVPYKETVMRLVDTWDGPTAEIGAANTLSRTADGRRVLASNTDGVGFEYATRDLALDGARVLLLGAGGVARGFPACAAECQHGFDLVTRGGQLAGHPLQRQAHARERVAEDHAHDRDRVLRCVPWLRAQHDHQPDRPDQPRAAEHRQGAVTAQPRVTPCAAAAGGVPGKAFQIGMRHRF